MKKYTFDYHGTTYKRISKTRARRAWDESKPFAMCPCNLSPVYGCHLFLTFINPADNKNETYTALNPDFDRTINEYEWYNCNNSETGKYTAFYMPIE